LTTPQSFIKFEIPACGRQANIETNVDRESGHQDAGYQKTRSSGKNQCRLQN